MFSTKVAKSSCRREFSDRRELCPLVDKSSVPKVVFDGRQEFMDPIRKSKTLTDCIHLALFLLLKTVPSSGRLPTDCIILPNFCQIFFIISVLGAPKVLLMYNL